MTIAAVLGTIAAWVRHCALNLGIGLGLHHHGSI